MEECVYEISLFALEKIATFEMWKRGKIQMNVYFK